MAPQVEVGNSRYITVSTRSPTTGEYLVPDRAVAFVPTSHVATRPHELSDRLAPMRYQVRWIGRTDVRSVDTDPMATRPTPIHRIAANAVSTFVLVMALGLAIAAVAPRALGYQSVVVVSGSMEPAIRVADVVVTTPSDGAELAAGAVINFDYEDSTRLHRITAITDNGYRTSGDANGAGDSAVVTARQVRGVGVVVVPFVGLPAVWAKDGHWLALASLLILLVGAGYMCRSRWLDERSAVFRP